MRGSGPGCRNWFGAALRCVDHECPNSPHSKVNETKKPQVKGLTWGLPESRLRDSNPRPTHYEGDRDRDEVCHTIASDPVFADQSTDRDPAAGIPCYTVHRRPRSPCAPRPLTMRRTSPHNPVATPWWHSLSRSHIRDDRHHSQAPRRHHSRRCAQQHPQQQQLDEGRPVSTSGVAAVGSSASVGSGMSMWSSFNKSAVTTR